MGFRGFETGVTGLDKMLGGGIRWGSTVTIASDLFDRETLCHQIAVNALKRGFIAYYLCFKETPERLRMIMREANFDPDLYEKKRLLRFFTPLETEQSDKLQSCN